MEKRDIENLKQEFLEKLRQIKSFDDLEKVRIEYLGRKRGKLTKVLRRLKQLSLEQKREIGPLANQLKLEIQKSLDWKVEQLKKIGPVQEFDITRPGKKVEPGHLHILTQTKREIRQIFLSLNFSVAEGPEIEDEYHNFDALNIPRDHPARDMWDTLWLKNPKNLLLRTHTSPVQIRYMEKNRPPFRIIAPGRVFRHEAIDASHQINFYQLEGLMVEKKVNLANFKYIIEQFLKKFFGKDVNIRYRPGYFPFVEPGLEIDIKIDNSDWLEIMGAGMVHPRVFKAVKYNPRLWQGFAFGLGIERMAMLKYKIPDIRLFYSGDLRFIKQF